MKKLILGSGSPRRSQLLSLLGFEFELRPSHAEEIIPADLPNAKAAEYLAELKSKAVEIKNDEILLTADTVVINNEQILGKPENADQAKQMLEQLSEKTHEVISGVCVREHDKTVSFSSTTEVKFKKLTTEEIDYYVEHFKPLDKAGAYGIQEWIGLVAVVQITGSFFNVVGLPCDEVYKVLTTQFGLEVSK